MDRTIKSIERAVVDVSRNEDEKTARAAGMATVEATRKTVEHERGLAWSVGSSRPSPSLVVLTRIQNSSTTMSGHSVTEKSVRGGVKHTL